MDDADNNRNVNDHAVYNRLQSANWSKGCGRRFGVPQRASIYRARGRDPRVTFEPAGDAMTIFEIKPSSLPSGEFAAVWFDDEQRSWEDERLHKVGTLGGEWASPRLKLFCAAERGVTDMLFNPNALAVSSRVRDELRRFPELEFLPIDVAGCGPFFVVHVTATVELSVGFSVRRATPPIGNIVELSEFSVGYTPPSSFFRVRQPTDSAGGRAGYCVRAMYANQEGASAVEAACGAYLSAHPLRERAPS